MKDDRSSFMVRDKVVVVKAVLPPKTAYVIWGKRLFDIIFSLIALTVMSPIIFVVWCLVAIDGGNGFYGQERVGKGRRVFTCWKLRSMVVNSDLALAKLCASNDDIAAEWDRNQKLVIDPRITRIGKFIRRTRIDELPQLWNVLVGDMSVVGPRPFMSAQLQIYVEAGGASYFRLRPGLTGPWQIAAKNDDEMAFVARVAYDNGYATQIGPWQDLGMIFKTIKTVLRMNGQ